MKSDWTKPAFREGAADGQPLSLLKNPDLRCQPRDGKGYHLQVSKLNLLPPLLPSISGFLNKLSDR